MAKKRDEIEEIEQAVTVPEEKSGVEAPEEPVRYAPTGYVHYEEPEQ